MSQNRESNPAQSDMQIGIDHAAGYCKEQLIQAEIRL